MQPSNMTPLYVQYFKLKQLEKNGSSSKVVLTFLLPFSISGSPNKILLPYYNIFRKNSKLSCEKMIK